MTTLLLLLIPFAATGLWFWKRGLYIYAERYALKHLEPILFSNSESQKEHIIYSMQKITNEKYSKEDLLDYFIKIKGLQVINFCDPVSFWTRKYLTSPTRLKLNYFEQVKFYEMFLNYPSQLNKPKNCSTKDYLACNPKGLFLHKKQLA